MSQQANQQTAAHIPAGWYPDPTGAAAERYWDGIAWSTEFTRSGQPAPAMMSGAVTGAIGDARYPTYDAAHYAPTATSSMPGIVIAGYIFAVLIPLIGLILAAVASGSHDSSVKPHGAKIALVAVAAMVFWIAVRVSAIDATG